MGYGYQVRLTAAGFVGYRYQVVRLAGLVLWGMDTRLSDWRDGSVGYGYQVVRLAGLVLWGPDTRLSD